MAKKRNIIHISPPYGKYLDDFESFSSLEERDKLIKKYESFSGFYATDLDPFKEHFHTSRKFNKLRKKDISSLIFSGKIIPSEKSNILDNKYVEIELSLLGDKQVKGSIEEIRIFPRKEYHLSLNHT